MQFRVWLESQITDPFVAKQLLGITSDSVTDEELKQAYRQAARIHHPDVGGDVNKMAEINSAYDLLQKHIGQKLPQEPQSKEDMLKNMGFSSKPQERPKNAKTVSEADVLSWCQKVLDTGFTVVVYRHPYEGILGLWRDLGMGPLGSAMKKQKMPPDIDAQKLLNSIKSYINNFPDSIIDLGVGKFDAWITYMVGGLRVAWNDKAQSISFEKPKEPKVKQPGVGMTKQSVVDKLHELGMTQVAGGNKNQYYGTGVGTEDYVIRLKDKIMAVINRAKLSDGTRYDVKASKDFYYGSVTPDIITAMVNLAKKRNAQKDQSKPA